ncbi:MFS general substrate transporter [Glarea lozoyensis ATCC 20868]|uniref:MFS general substrate transporter n=1 Tax=Glarea lozoyensis (strain ATCC 20868 / MF5171) TaxID=1116229 RepID=S3D3V2_GLAL2|nr:MFS general substrate transporter [Glarea lozoyensis ATCC 20868]EPE32480.1 MFS general substrate transporter [Glarea lozoyensis ATCC 20868]
MALHTETLVIKQPDAFVSNGDGSVPDSEESAVDTQAQPGVQNIEAVTVAWTKTALIVAYVMLWLIYFVEGTLSGTNAALNPYVTSDFAQHSLTPTVGILSSVIGGVTDLTLAKILDVFGRPQGYFLCIVIATVGLVMMAACNNVEAYAAAQVFYTVGNNGIQYSLSVFVADTSSLRNRGLMIALVTSPSLITCWLAGPISSAFLRGPGWRWCYGAFSVIVPAFTLPLLGIFIYNYFKAKKQGLIAKHQSQRTPWESLVYYLREFDAAGLILLSAGVALFLLPFNLYTLQEKGWRAPLIICLLVFGILLIVLFALWERFLAPVTFIPYALLLDRTVFGACILSNALFLSYFCWNSFFSSFLQVVVDLSISEASYVIQAYTVGTCLSAIGVGLLVRNTGRYKPVCLYFGIPLSILGLGLMINFRRPGVNVGYLVMCQIFMAFAAGTIIICDEIAIMAAASHQHIAIVIAILGVFSSIGGAIGLTVAAAIWQDVFPKKLAEYLPPEELPNLPLIYADIVTQLSYAVGSPTRLAIQYAYGDAQKMLLVVGTAVWFIGLLAVVMWRDINVSNIKQVKGTAF